MTKWNLESKLHLQHVTYICLDMFKAIIQNVSTELEAWLTFLSSDQPGDIMKVIDGFPEFRELYQDMIRFRGNPKEVVAMYTDAFKEAERGTMEYMIDEMKKKMKEDAEQSQKKIEQLQKENEHLKKTIDQMK